MKRQYCRPTLEIEYYTLELSIASNCTTIVSSGPAIAHHTACEEYEDMWGDLWEDPWNEMDGSGSLSVASTGFYEDVSTCSCYYTASGDGTFSS